MRVNKLSIHNCFFIFPVLILGSAGMVEAALPTRSILSLDPPEKAATNGTISTSAEASALQRIANLEQAASASFLHSTQTNGIMALESDWGDEEQSVTTRLERMQTQHMLDRAEELVSANDVGGAIVLLEEQLQNVGDEESRFMIYHRLGAYAFRLQNYRSAARYMGEAIALRPNNLSIRCNLAAVRLTIGDTDAAIALLEDIPVNLVRNPELVFSIHFNLACAYSLKNNIETSREHFLKAAQANPQAAYTSVGDPQLDNLRKDPEFQLLLKQLEMRVER